MLTQAAAKRWDVVVVGAGPAGTLTARGIAQTGASVLLVERAAFPRYKVCGCCLNPRSIELLGTAGLGSLLKEAGATPLHGVTIAAGGRRSAVALPAGFALSRQVFDAALVEAAIKTGVDFLPQTPAKLEPSTNADHRLVTFRQGSQETVVEARFVVDASGLGGKLAADLADEVSPNSRIGAGVMIDHAEDDYPPGIIHMACGKDGYVGLVRVEAGRLDVATAFDPAAVKEAGGLGPLAVRILAEAGFPAVAGLEDMPWKGTPFLTRRRESLAEERVFRIGDAAGYVEPFTGEGMAWALASAVSVVPILQRGLSGDTNGLAGEWVRAYQRQVARRQMICRWTSRVLRRPRLTKLLVRFLALAPGLAGPVLRGMHRR
ncbi:NAD(P)/FAD-dependent oxidoreductase [Zavarzinella formosa]|uniref:NAD(P)/FAD-dependent oxidoreductase n=1 Tax=Zavarzinella formosa TaxID=360055 RepID=UPI0003823399|nr:NAD(P)/FAD-dependent oxidoreductase [Zavarzinella formosa]